MAGINTYVENVAGRLADQGYVCLALDYFAREGGPPDLSDMQKILAAVAALPDPRILSDMRAGLDYLEARRVPSRRRARGVDPNDHLPRLVSQDLGGSWMT
ncbi:MAG: hypothetical protein GEV03_23445 [Streptosporangiales bacterium]|nr:hypothetical protein [Streptosporangiales bacterium]